MTVTFHADASSFQAAVSWRAVRAAGFGGGAEKVSQGTSYWNPYWPAARLALLAEAGPEFTPGAYLYLEAGNGGGQADYFAAHAGPLPGFVIWLDLERAAGVSPSVADARDCAARLRQLYPHNRIGLYAGESFTGSAYLTFADLLWSPHYVTGTGTPAQIYRSVPASWWGAYGGRTPVMVQFSQSAAVPGVAGQADVSAFRGTAAQMRAALLGAPAPVPAPATVPEDPDMIIVSVARTGVPAGVTWPGDFLLDSAGGLHHITDAADLAAYQARLGAPVTISYGEFLARGPVVA